MKKRADLVEFTESLARQAGELALTYFRRLDEILITQKGHQDLVTDGDKAVERFIREELAKGAIDYASAKYILGSTLLRRHYNKATHWRPMRPVSLLM